MSIEEGGNKTPPPIVEHIRGLIVDILVTCFGIIAAFLYLNTKDALFSSIVYITLGFVTKTAYDKGERK